ncbi:MAG: MbnP family protein [Bacteroidota bacterium]
MKHMRLILLWILLISLFTSCENEEACLDANATNFEAGADKDCCCEYPILSVRMAYVAGDVSFSVDSTYTDGAGNPFQVTEIPMYLSQFALTKIDGSTLSVEDTVVANDINGNALTLPDDVVILNSNTFLYELGTFRDFGSINQLSFAVGLSETANQADPSSFEAEHPLSITEDSLYLSASEGYLFSRLTINYNNGSNLSLPISGNNNRVDLHLDLSTSIDRGFDFEVQLDFDIPSLFSDVDLLNDSPNTIQEKIVTNSTAAFAVQN